MRENLMTQQKVILVEIGRNVQKTGKFSENN